MVLKCIITDDEPIARDILEDFIRSSPNLQLIAKCSNAMETFEKLKRHDIDLLFMDVQMPGINGIDFIKSLKSKPYIIFTTAFSTYAIEGFEVEAVDYLLKPISFDRFLKAVDRVFNLAQNKLNSGSDPLIKHNSINDFFFIKSDSGLSRIDFDKILYIEGMENYVKFICENKTIMSLTTMKSLNDVLPQEIFLRIHRSYIVNMHKVDRVWDFNFYINNKTLQIGKSYKKTVLDILKSKYLAIIK